MLASIIIPIHNTFAQDRSEMISDLLLSIPNRHDIEVVIVDDRSSLPYRIEVEPRAFQTIEIPNTPGAKYAGMARNAGIQRARGLFTIFADSDDLFDTSAFGAVLDALQGADEDVVLFKTSSFGDGPLRHENINSASRKVAEGKDRLGALAWYGSPVGLCIKTAFLARNGVTFPEMRVSEDRVFCARLASMRPTTRVLDITAYQIRSHASLVGGGPHPDIFRDVLQATRLANHALSDTGMKNAQLSMLRPIREYARAFPAMAAMALIQAVVAGDPILPRRFRG